MKKAFIIPHHNLTGTNTRETLKKAIDLLSTQYMIDWEVMTDEKRINLLETIANLTHIYFNMSLEE